MIPSDALSQVRPGECDEDTKRNYFLDDFQLECCEFTIAEPIRGDLKTVFSKRYQPAYDDCGK